MAIDLIGKYRFSECAGEPSVVDMTTYGTVISAADRSRSSRLRLGLPNLVWALAATYFVSRAGGLVRSFLVLYLTQERQLSAAAAGAVVAAVGVGVIGSQI